VLVAVAVLALVKLPLLHAVAVQAGLLVDMWRLPFLLANLAPQKLLP
jgi:hypothetical protein